MDGPVQRYVLDHALALTHRGVGDQEVELTPRRGEVVFPWQLKVAISVARRLLPTPVIEMLMARYKPPERTANLGDLTAENA